MKQMYLKTSRKTISPHTISTAKDKRILQLMLNIFLISAQFFVIITDYVSHEQFMNNVA